MHRIGRTLLAVLFIVLAASANAGTRPGQGDIPPPYLGKDAHGDAVNVENLRGKVVIVTFWATWCGYCMKELPILGNLQQVAGASQLQVVAISHQESKDVFRQVRRRLDNLKLGLILTDDSDNSISKTYGVNGIPHMVMIGRDGRIAQVYRGYDESMLDDIVKDINGLLAQPAAPPVAAP
jgi:thiol-disulfide isomerase/thioredoxin